jgi:hypothetical protein
VSEQPSKWLFSILLFEFVRRLLFIKIFKMQFSRPNKLIAAFPQKAASFFACGRDVPKENGDRFRTRGRIIPKVALLAAPACAA